MVILLSETYPSQFNQLCHHPPPVKVDNTLFFISHYFLCFTLSLSVEDFVAISENKQFEIQKQTEPICIIVYPNDDMTLEEDESFFVTIIANPPVSTSLSRLMASVIIRDDDSKYRV